MRPRSAAPKSACWWTASCGWPQARPTGRSAPSPRSELQKLAARLRAETARNEAEQAQHTLLAADIKRFLERPADPWRIVPAPAAPPGAPIGDMPLDWLAPAPW